MERAQSTVLIAFAFAMAVVIPAIAVEGPEPRAVPTETIVVPPEQPSADPAKPAGDVAAPLPAPATEALPAVEYDVSTLPAPVRRIREQIIDAAATGDPEAFRPIFEANGAPQLGADEPHDSIAYLASLSGDPGGREILAILIEVFEAGYVHVDAGTDDEMYLWPYFARYPIEKLTPPQQVELFKLVLPGDFEDMQAFGFYNWFRAGIAPDGTWLMFTTD